MREALLEIQRAIEAALPQLTHDWRSAMFSAASALSKATGEPLLMPALAAPVVQLRGKKKD
jgi:hypothetical protein